jgi:hypothetical protein
VSVPHTPFRYTLRDVRPLGGALVRDLAGEEGVRQHLRC